MMKLKNLWISIFALTVALVVGSMIGRGQNSTESHDVWEYKVTGPLNEQKLNELGVQGWELVQYVGPVEGKVDAAGYYPRMFFKRLK